MYVIWKNLSIPPNFLFHRKIIQQSYFSASPKILSISGKVLQLPKNCWALQKILSIFKNLLALQIFLPLQKSFGASRNPWAHHKILGSLKKFLGYPKILRLYIKFFAQPKVHQLFKINFRLTKNLLTFQKSNSAFHIKSIALQKILTLPNKIHWLSENSFNIPLNVCTPPHKILQHSIKLFSSLENFSAFERYPLDIKNILRLFSQKFFS